MSTTTNHTLDADVDTDALNAVFAEMDAARPTINAGPPTRPLRTRMSAASFEEDDTPSRNWLSIFFAVVSIVCFSIGLFKHFQPSTPTIMPSAVASVPAAPEFNTVTRKIEDFDVGLRVAGRNPLRDQVDSLPEPDPLTSRKLLLRMQKESGLYLKVKLLRSLDWIELVGATEGGTFYLELPEMGAVGDAFVEAVLPCPEIKSGPGNIVTGVFEHEAEPDAKILSVTFANGSNIKGVTDNHPFFSVDRNAFIAIGEMKEGETVRVTDGTTTITQLESRIVEPGTMLYNLETHNEHVFQVTLAGILVHNTCELDFVRLKRPRQLADQVKSNRFFKLDDAEMGFVDDLLRRKEGMQIFRTNQMGYLGDFLIIDKSNPRSVLGYIVDLKTGGGSAGSQMVNALEAKRLFGIHQFDTISGTADELLEFFSRGRGAFPQ